MSKPKVVIIFPAYFHNQSNHYPYWYPVFARASHQLDLVVFFETGESPPPLGEAKTYQAKWQSKPLNLLERWFVLLKLRWQGYTHFYVHYSIFSLILAKIITVVFGGKTYFWDCEYYVSPPENVWQQRAIRWTDVLVTGHAKIGEQYQKVLNLKDPFIKIVPNWVVGPEDTVADIGPRQRLSLHAPDEVSKKPVNILFVHHLSPRKGSRELPKIVQQVVKQMPDVKFTIIGDGPDYSFLRFWAERNNVKQVDIKGELERSVVDRMFQEADLFIMPSQAEGFPRVILEAMKYGIPYISTDVGCVREITPKALQTWMVKPGDAQAFAQKIVMFLKLSESEKKAMVVALKKAVREHSLDKTIQAFVKVFI